MRRACTVLAAALEDRVVSRAVPGIHLEGPCISPLDGPRGAHPKRYVKTPSIKDFDKLMEAVNGKVLYTTVAPEIKGATAYIKAVVRRGVTVSLGHHAAGAACIRKAADAGAKMCTHLGNGLASTIDRHVNPLWPQLAEDRLAAALIPDLQHLPPEALKVFVRAKGVSKTVFASDCIHVALLKPGNYELAGAKVELTKAGRVCLSGTDFLAGSALMLLQGVVNAVRAADVSIEDAFACASAVPAKLLGLNKRFGRPSVGKKPDMVVFDIKNGKVKVKGVFVGGELVKKR